MQHNTPINIADRLTLCEALDRVLHKGVVLVGHVTISVADIDLIHINLQLMASSAANLYQKDHKIAKSQENPVKEVKNHGQEQK